MKKRILTLSIVLALAALVLVPAPVLADGTATVSIPAVTLDEDATFNVAVAIDDTTATPDMELNAFNFDIVVDTDTLTLNSVTAGTLISGWNVLMSAKQTGVPHAGSDWWRIDGWTGATQLVSGDGELVVLNFTANAAFDDTDSTVLDLDLCTLSDVDAIAITPTLTDGSATVDLLEVTAIGVVGDNTGTSEGYVSGSGDATTFTLTPTVEGGSASYSTYLWGFGTDGSGTTGAATPDDVLYSTAGAKSITLTVTDSHGSTSTFTVGAVSATIYADLVAAFSGTPVKGIVKLVEATWTTTAEHPSTVSFDSTTTAGGKASYTYAWDFDTSAADGDTSTDQNPSFNYATIISGSFTGQAYEVELAVTDSLLPATDTEVETAYITIYAVGDVDGNLLFQAADVTKIARVIVLLEGTTFDFTSDVNDDGDINALDITQTAILVT